MLVNPPPHLSHALSLMHCKCVYAWNKLKGKEKLPHGGGSDGGLIGPRNTAQFNFCRSWRNPPMTSLIRPSKGMIEWMVLFKKLSPSKFQFSKIIIELFFSTSFSNNEVWLRKTIHSNRIGTNTDSGIWLRSSRDSKVGVEICLKIESKPKN